MDVLYHRKKEAWKILHFLKVNTNYRPHCLFPVYPSSPAARTRGCPRLLTAKEAAERLGVVTDTILDWCQSKRLRHRKIGRMVRIDPADLEEFERQRTVEPRL